MKSSLQNQLTKLQEKLSTLDKAVEISTTTAKNTTKKQQEYASQLTNLQDSLNQPHPPLTSYLKLYHNESETILNHYDTQVIEIENLLKSYQPLISQTQNLLNTINEMDFPTRLNQLDTSISTINEGVKNVKNNVNELLSNLEDEEKSANVIKIVIFCLSALSIGGIIWLLM